MPEFINSTVKTIRINVLGADIAATGFIIEHAPTNLTLQRFLVRRLVKRMNHELAYIYPTGMPKEIFDNAFEMNRMAEQVGLRV